MAVLIFAVHGKMKPASLKTPYYKKSPTRRKGETLELLLLVRQRVLKLQFYGFVLML
ncbi:hypothetical protein [Treponema phagedenis]|uniref:hypothetical protein n=1 Tax=Treponema phagedenis TaxID=162 RepID=UPI0004BCAF45|nr:hypothetical protein [Treponema phagedenis]